jgi:hypothetical protein
MQASRGPAVPFGAVAIAWITMACAPPAGITNGTLVVATLMPVECIELNFPARGHLPPVRMMWYDGDTEFERHEWRHGFVFAPPDGMFHQHFNTSTRPARYLAVSLGSHRYPVLAQKVKLKQAPDADVRDGGLQIDYKDQDPRIHGIWRREMTAVGIPSRMGKYFAEDREATEAAP